VAKVVSCHLYLSTSQNLYTLPTPVPLNKGVFACPFLGLLRLHGAIRTFRGGRPNQLSAAMSAMEARRQLAERKALGMQLEGGF